MERLDKESIMPKALKLDNLENSIFDNISTPKMGVVFEMLSHHFPLKMIKTKDQHEAAKKILTRIAVLIVERKIVDRNTIQDIREYLDALSTLVEKYELDHFKNLGKVSGREMLLYLMELKGLNQSDLKNDLGGQSIVSNILNGKRELNVRQIRTLSKRFKVSPIVFF
jgi:antitoxin component HigA of HigAB toxin-antitoxin module